MPYVTIPEVYQAASALVSSLRQGPGQVPDMLIFTDACATLCHVGSSHGCMKAPVGWHLAKLDQMHQSSALPESSNIACRFRACSGCVCMRTGHVSAQCPQIHYTLPWQFSAMPNVACVLTYSIRQVRILPPCLCLPGFKHLTLWLATDWFAFASATAWLCLTYISIGRVNFCVLI